MHVINITCSLTLISRVRYPSGSRSQVSVVQARSSVLTGVLRSLAYLQKSYVVYMSLPCSPSTSTLSPGETAIATSPYSHETYCWSIWEINNDRRITKYHVGSSILEYHRHTSKVGRRKSELVDDSNALCELLRITDYRITHFSNF